MLCLMLARLCVLARQTTKIRPVGRVLGGALPHSHCAAHEGGEASGEWCVRVHALRSC